MAKRPGPVPAPSAILYTANRYADPLADADALASKGTVGDSHVQPGATHVAGAPIRQDVPKPRTPGPRLTPDLLPRPCR